MAFLAQNFRNVNNPLRLGKCNIESKKPDVSIRETRAHGRRGCFVEVDAGPSKAKVD